MLVNIPFSSTILMDSSGSDMVRMISSTLEDSGLECISSKTIAFLKKFRNEVKCFLYVSQNDFVLSNSHRSQTKSKFGRK